MNFEEMYGEYDGMDMSTLTHIPEISCYNHNYYIGLKRKGHAAHDLIFAEGNDDNIIEYYVVNGSSRTYIGYEFSDEGVFCLANN